VKIQNKTIKIETITEYPYQNKFSFKISNPNDVQAVIKIRKPSWASQVITKEMYTLENDLIVIDRKLGKEDAIQIEFTAEIQIIEDTNKEKYFRFGALLYAKPIAAIEQKRKSYFPNFDDFTYKPIETTRYQFTPKHQARFKDGKIEVSALNKGTNQEESITLIPFGKTILRQVSF
jgi:DUF1680 family protein